MNLRKLKESIGFAILRLAAVVIMLALFIIG